MRTGRQRSRLGLKALDISPERLNLNSLVLELNSLVLKLLLKLLNERRERS